MWLLLGVPILLFAVYLYFVSDPAPRFDLKGKRVIVTGGSSGIGLAIAEALLRAGSHVTIIGRNQDKLNAAAKLLQPIVEASTCSLQTKSADVSDSKRLTAVINDVSKDGLDALITCAGYSRPGRFLEIPEEEFERQMQIDYLGTVYSVRAAVPHLKRNTSPSGTRMILVSSMAGQAGVVGYSAYSPAKFAIRGLAEVLSMELRPDRIRVSVCNPPDVDTPGYEEENKFKPEECRLVSEGSGVFKAQDIAADVIAGLVNWKYSINSGFDGKMLAVLAAGSSPSGDFLSNLAESLFMGLIRAVSLAYALSFRRIVASQRRKDAVAQKNK